MALESPLLWLQNTNTDVWEKVMIELVRCRKKNVFKELEHEWSEYKSKLSGLQVIQSSVEDYIHPCRILLYKNLEPVYSWGERCHRIIAEYSRLHRLDNIIKNRMFVYGFELITQRYINRRIFTDNGLKYICVNLEFIKYIRDIKKTCEGRLKLNGITLDEGIIKALSKLEDKQMIN